MFELTLNGGINEYRHLTSFRTLIFLILSKVYHAISQIIFPDFSSMQCLIENIFLGVKENSYQAVCWNILAKIETERTGSYVHTWPNSSQQCGKVLFYNGCYDIHCILVSHDNVMFALEFLQVNGIKCPRYRNHFPHNSRMWTEC